MQAHGIGLTGRRATRYRLANRQPERQYRVSLIGTHADGFPVFSARSVRLFGERVRYGYLEGARDAVRGRGKAALWVRAGAAPEGVSAA